MPQPTTLPRAPPSFKSKVIICIQTDDWIPVTGIHIMLPNMHKQNLGKNRRIKHTEGVTSFLSYGIWVKPRHWKIILLYESYIVMWVFVTKEEIMIQSQNWLITDFIQQHVRNWKEYIGRTNSDGAFTKIIRINPEIRLQNGTRKVKEQKSR
jgi:hypothetical protein